MLRILFLLCFFVCLGSYAQPIVLEFADPCFGSVGEGANLESGDIVTQNGDIVSWNGGSWEGANWKAGLLKAPLMPDFCSNKVKAAWIGSGVSWNLNGEGIALRLKQRLQYGKSYILYLTYVSHGNSSDGNFAPFIASSQRGKDLGYPIGRMRGADTAWHLDSLVFTASLHQDGDEWLIIHTRTIGSSGMILAPCPQSRFRIQADKSFCNGEEVKLFSSIPLSNYKWSDGSGAEDIVVTESGMYWLESQSACGTYRDSMNVEFINCGAGVGVKGGSGKGKGKGINVRFNFQFCWFGACDDEDVATGPPSPPIVVYNVLSVNGDGLNEIFYVDNVKLGRWKLRVYNRYGQLVFEDMEYQNDWVPSELTAGVYYVVLKDRNSSYKYKGTLTIIR